MLLRQSVVGLAFLVTGIIISSLNLFDVITPIKTFQKEIFNTNCLILFADFPVNSGDLLPEQPKICSMIEWTLAPSFIANGIVIMIFGINKMTSILSILNLLVFMTIYCNPNIDPSFKCFSHFIQILVCIAYFMRKAISKPNPQQNK